MNGRQDSSSYEEKKAKLVKELGLLNKASEPIYLKKQTSNLFRHRAIPTKGIDVRNFSNLIDIDTQKMVANVEGMITYDSLVQETLKYSCLPTVVPELKTITVGGALTGCGIESSSFKYGLVHETVEDFDVLLSDGNIVLASLDNQYRELFLGFPNSYGTLGYALRVKIKLYPVKPIVKLTHLHFEDKQAFFARLKHLCMKRDSNELAFVEGVLFSQKDLVISIGTFVDEAPYLSDYTSKNIYYRSLEYRNEDYLTTYDYIWRWDTDWFWCSKFFMLQHPLMRKIMGKKRMNSANYWKIRKFFAQNFLAKSFYNIFSSPTESIIQDVQIPIERAAEFLEFFENKIGISPIWICPTFPYREDIKFDLYPLEPKQLYVNFGFWDVKPLHKSQGFYNRLIEAKVSELGGKKSLYSNVYYNEEEFWKIYNKEHYDNLKYKFDPSNRFRNLYDKCHESLN